MPSEYGEARRPRRADARGSGRAAYDQEDCQGLAAASCRGPGGSAMRAFPIVLLVAFLLMPLLAVGATSLADESLPTDPALVRGALPNGLRYIIRPHKNPE